MPAGRPEALTFPMIASHAVDRGRKTGAGALVLSRIGGRTRNLVGRDLRQQINQLVRGAGVHGGKNKFFSRASGISHGGCVDAWV